MKAEIAKKITEAFVEVTGSQEARSVVRVLFHELPKEDCWVAGEPVTQGKLEKLFPFLRK